MTTVAVSLDVSKTEVRSRTNMFSLRAAHKDVDDLNHITNNIEVGETATYVSTRFFYSFLRDSVDTVTITAGSPAVDTVLTDVVGILAFPYPCTVKFNIPLNSPIVLPRRLEAVYV